MLIHGDCVTEMRRLLDRGVRVHSVVTDPPYGLTSVVKRFGKDGSAPAKSEGATGVYARASAGFMGQKWDGTGIEHNVEMWRLCYDLLLPGGFLLAFGGTRTWHRIASAIEDAGFEIRDTIAWLYGTGFPKSHDVSKGIDATLVVGRARTEDLRRLAMGGDYEPSGRGRRNYDHGGGSVMNGEPAKGLSLTPEAAAWQGWGTALKPAFEPIIVARKPLAGTVAQNVLAHGTGALNIDGCRVPTEENLNGGRYSDGKNESDGPTYGTGLNRRSRLDYTQPTGRWPANVVHDGSDEVEAAFAAFGDRGAAAPVSGDEPSEASVGRVTGKRARVPGVFHADTGTASRFFYCAKATRKDRNEGCEDLPESPLLWSAGQQNPGSFQAEGTRKASENNHPTVKPTELMRWLCRLVTPPGGTVLDPFMGSGSTGKAAALEGFNFVGIEQEARYLDIARRRIGFVKPDDLLALLARAAAARQALTEAMRGA